MTDPLVCERCRAALEPDDAVSIIEGVCPACRGDGFSSLVRPLSAVDALLRGTNLPLEEDPLFAESPPVPAAQPTNFQNRKTPAPRPLPARPTGALQVSSGSAAHRNEPWPRPSHAGYRESPLQAATPAPEYRRSWQGEGEAAHPSGRIVVPMMQGGARTFSRTGVRRRRRDLAVGVAIGLIVTVSVTAYFLTYRGRANPLVTAVAAAPTRSLHLTVTPPWATVTLNDEEIGPPDEAGKLDLALPGDAFTTASLQVSADGYHTARRPLSTLTGVKDVFIELVRRPYQVVVRTNPPQAEVWADGELKGYTPLTMSLLPTETPSLSLRRAGYAEVLREITPPDKGDTIDLDVFLLAANLTVQVESDPPGAMIALDGVVRGPSPLAVEMDPSYLGKDVAITASLSGYDDAATELAVPLAGAPEPIPVRLALTRKQAVVEFWTTPPGGHVVIDGREAGAAPVTVKFDSDRVGSTITVAASLGASYHGKRELTVPPVGEPLRTTILMELNVQRVVFLLSCPREAGLGTGAAADSAAMRPIAASGSPAEAVILADQLIETLGELTPQQRFALLLDTEDGIETWPSGQATEAATSEQKVRAYDAVRSARLSGGGRVADAVQRALELQPDTIWLFAAGELKENELQQLSESTESENVTVHIVRTASDEQDVWLRDLAVKHQGTLTVLGQGQLPAIAQGQEEP